MNPETLMPLIKNHRRMWVEIGYGDMPPTVMAIRGGKVVATVTAPQIDKMYGLRAAALCRDGLSADALMIVLDSHIREEKMPEGMTPEEAAEDFRRRFPPGSMQKMCDEQGACEAGILSDCLICQYHDAEGTWMKSLLYNYDNSKDKSALEWTTEKDYPDGTVMGGIHRIMRSIMAQPRGCDNPGVLTLQHALKLTPEDTYNRMGRAAVRAFTELKYAVFVDKDHPELIPDDCNSTEFGLPQWYDK